MASLGERLRELRSNRNLTLKEVSEQSGLSMAFLSLVERDKVSISVENLERLARFYQIRLVQIFEQIEDKPVFVTRAGQVEERIAASDPSRSAFVLLAPRGGIRMEPVLAEVAPGYGDPQFRTHEGENLLYVLSGGVRVETERGEVVELWAGDSAYLPGFPGYRIHNASGSQAARVLMVVSPPTTRRDDVLDREQGILIQSEQD